MLTHECIVRAVETVAPRVGATKVSYFGSYALGSASGGSDLDILIEFDVPAVSLLTIIDFKNQLEDELGISVDVIHAPLPDDALITIEKAVPVYDVAA